MLKVGEARAEKLGHTQESIALFNFNMEIFGRIADFRIQIRIVILSIQNQI